MTNVHHAWTCYLLGWLLAIVALNALGGGYYVLSGAHGVSAEWLAGSPFRGYFIPSLFLVIVVGGSALFTALAVFSRHRLNRVATFVSGLILLTWIVVQVIVIGFMLSLQPAMAITALLILLLGWMLPVHTRYSAACS